MTEQQPLNTTRYFCSSGICSATDCRCPKIETGYPTIREWWADVEHRRITLYMASVGAIAIAVYLYGVFNR